MTHIPICLKCKEHLKYQYQDGILQAYNPQPELPIETRLECSIAQWNEAIADVWGTPSPVIGYIKDDGTIINSHDFETPKECPYLLEHQIL